MTLAHQFLLALAVAALLAAGWRAGGRLSADTLERAIVAAVLAGAAMVAEALLLGRIGIANRPGALTGAAVATWIAVRAAFAPTVSPPWWRALSARERWALGAALGALVAYVAWMWRHPAVGLDGTLYHLPEALGWVHAGNTGSTPHVWVEFPTGSYPLTNEVALAWAMAISRSFVPIAPWTGVVVVLFSLSGWVGLRRLGCNRSVTIAAIAAVLTTPLLIEHLNTPKNDLPALAWLAACAALCACAVPVRPALLGPALAAAGLAVGSKTPTAPLAALALGAALWGCRGRLRAAAPALGWGALAAVGVGGVWYLRNLIAHGWLFWPFGSGPFGGDPEPAYLRPVDGTFLQHPRYTLQGRTDIYLREIGGGLVLMAGGIIAPLLARRRTRLVLGAAAATAIAALAWTVSPTTGRASDPILGLDAIGTLRYLLPVFAAGAAALALAARTSRLARIALAAALIWSVVRSVALGVTVTPSAGTLIAGAVGGAFAAWLAGRGRVRSRLVVAAAALVAVVVAAHNAGGWLARAAATNGSPGAPVEAWFAALPGWSDDDAPVAFANNVVGPIAGDRLRHPVTLIPADEPCGPTLRRTRDGWVVIRVFPPAVRPLLIQANAPGCLAGVKPVARTGDWLVYRQGGVRRAG